ncbi:hypothetical protein GWK47_042328 [Chionoecetes opilio]|uniref:Uncharacterized protein n=1 Tax=Chionoecetes opilio TaxID=41210 RepID=A0A8J4YAE2_CHIOP|nr:hypothetical protein GWK47_042328 [Chionoecetes opilio]
MGTTRALRTQANIADPGTLVRGGGSTPSQQLTRRQESEERFYPGKKARGKPQLISLVEKLTEEVFRGKNAFIISIEENRDPPCRHVWGGRPKTPHLEQHAYDSPLTCRGLTGHVGLPYTRRGGGTGPVISTSRGKKICWAEKAARQQQKGKAPAAGNPFCKDEGGRTPANPRLVWRSSVKGQSTRGGLRRPQGEHTFEGRAPQKAMALMTSARLPWMTAPDLSWGPLGINGGLLQGLARRPSRKTPEQKIQGAPFLLPGGLPAGKNPPGVVKGRGPLIPPPVEASVPQGFCAGGAPPRPVWENLLGQTSPAAGPAVSVTPDDCTLSCSYPRMTKSVSADEGQSGGEC